MKPRKLMGICLLIGLFVLSACKPKDDNATPTDVLDDIRTVAARTIEALTTQMLQTSEAMQTESPPEPMDTELPPVPTQEAPDPATEVPTADFSNTPEAVATPTNADKPCDLAAFVGETLPDGSQLYPGTMFTKTWTLRNEGSCTWTSDYAVVFTSGDSMSAPAATQLSKSEVKPGESVEVSVPLIAPGYGGKFRADFKLRNAAGVLFAFKNPDQTFWVDIEVVEGVIHLANSYCGASWTSQAGNLHCPGQPTDPSGYVYSDNAPMLETGAIDDEPTLWMGINNAPDAYVMGVYPAMRIPNNAYFSTVLGCAHNFNNCRVKFVLAYQEGDGAIQQLGSWDETYDGELNRIKLDISELGGRTVKIILILRSMDSSVDGRIHLLEPVIKP